ncbi:MAG TPA: hypothetical protein VEI07_14400 [Planctomycetaceae bacterium]|nr:hypothetical protein [Planctomycetaceae bacterium]
MPTAHHARRADKPLFLFNQISPNYQEQFSKPLGELSRLVERRVLAGGAGAEGAPDCGID